MFLAMGVAEPAIRMMDIREKLNLMTEKREKATWGNQKTKEKRNVEKCPKRINKKSPVNLTANRAKKSLAATYSPVLLRTVPSAMRGLTSEFGMGSGITLSLLPPRLNLDCRKSQIVFTHEN